MLANVAEEGHELETIPFLQGADRKALITRKLGQHFLGSPLATAISLGYEKSKRKNEKLLLSALTNPAHFEPWLKCLRRSRRRAGRHLHGGANGRPVAEETGQAEGAFAAADLSGPFDPRKLPGRRPAPVLAHDAAFRQQHRRHRLALCHRSSQALPVSGWPAPYRAQRYAAGLYPGAPASHVGGPPRLHRFAIGLSRLSTATRPPENSTSRPCRATAAANYSTCTCWPPHRRASSSPPKPTATITTSRRFRYGLLGLGAVALLGGGLFAAKQFVTWSLRQETQALVCQRSDRAGVTVEFRRLSRNSASTTRLCAASPTARATCSSSNVCRTTLYAW